MPTRCKTIAGQRVTLGPGKPVLAGSELLDGSILCNGVEEFPLQFVEHDGCVTGENGATLIWPDTGNDLVKFDPNEHVPVGTHIFRGKVNDGGTWFDAPHTVENEGAYAGGPNDGASDGTDGTESGGEDGEEDGFCAGTGNVDLPSEEDESFLEDLANLEIPDLKAFMLSGFTAKIQELMGKLSSALGKLQTEVDDIMETAILSPEDVCKPPLTTIINGLLALMKKLMEIIPIMQKIIRVIKIIQKVVKLVIKILKWTPPFIVPIVEALINVLNVMGLVDMCVSLITRTIGRFATIVPILQAQLMSVLAACAGQQEEGLSKEDCEALGHTWIDPDEIQKLQDMYNKITDATSGMTDDDGSVGFCSITEHLTKKECEDAGGNWTELDTDSNLEDVDTSILSEELGKQLEELDRCFADEELDQYLRGL
mgnify:CR=1 FL=1